MGGCLQVEGVHVCARLGEVLQCMLMQTSRWEIGHGCQAVSGVVGGRLQVEGVHVCARLGEVLQCMLTQTSK